MKTRTVKFMVTREEVWFPEFDVPAHMTDDEALEDWRSPEVFDRCKKRITVDNKQVRIKRQTFLDLAKSAHGCCQCAEKHPASLCFHHHKTNKLFSIGNATHYKWSTIVAELRKCFVLCHNCHAKHHYAEKERGA